MLADCLNFFSSSNAASQALSRVKIRLQSQYISGKIALSLLICAGWHKIHQSVLVVIFTQDLQVLLLNVLTSRDFVISRLAPKDQVDEAWQTTAEREVMEETGLICRDYELQDWQLENIYEFTRSGAIVMRRGS